jgi:cytochrome c peroxidase
MSGMRDSRHLWRGIAVVWAVLMMAPLAAAEDAVTPATAAPEGEDLVLEGLRLFTQETFGGNGRVCASCHPPTNNYTIDPAFIRTLPAGDPLFVAEFDPNLGDLERSALLRERALILVNVDGFDKPAVSRSVPHLLGLSQTISPGRRPFSRVHMTGWSGDGAPGDGALRSFATGAVRQHFTRTMARRACTAASYDPARCDFRLPTDAELDALEAFQLTIGRQSEINIEPFSRRPGEIVFRDLNVETGKFLFHTIAGGDNLACSTCHRNAGANDRSGNGRLFDVGANKDEAAPACLEPGAVPGDGGFGRVIETTESGRTLCGGTTDFPVRFFGNDRFNTPSVIEAADTGPFFHNNIVDGVEESVRFYNSSAFARSESAGGLAFNFFDEEIDQIGALLRTLNALDNMSNADRLGALARRQATPPDVAALAVRIAASETEDAIQVLTGGPLRLYRGAGVVSLLTRALAAEQAAIAAPDPALLSRAIRLRQQARDRMIGPRED